jgi:hypothetical protein
MVTNCSRVSVSSSNASWLSMLVKALCKFINLAGRNKEGVRILDFQADGHGHVLGDEDVVVNPGQRNLFVKADPGKLVNPVVVQHIPYIVCPRCALCNVPGNNKPKILLPCWGEYALLRGIGFQHFRRYNLV